MYVAEPAHVLELAIVVHLPRISQRHPVDLCCKLSFFFLESLSLEYPDTNQIFPRSLIITKNKETPKGYKCPIEELPTKDDNT